MLVIEGKELPSGIKINCSPLLLIALALGAEVAWCAGADSRLGGSRAEGHHKGAVPGGAEGHHNLLPLTGGACGLMERSTLQESLVQAAIEAQELAGTVCPRVERLTPAQFLRDFVLPNKPCIITGLMKDWPAMRHWTDDDYLRAKLGDKKVSINVTPNGRGDAGEHTQMLFFKSCPHSNCESSSSDTGWLLRNA